MMSLDGTAAMCCLDENFDKGCDEFDIKENTRMNRSQVWIRAYPKYLFCRLPGFSQTTSRASLGFVSNLTRKLCG